MCSRVWGVWVCLGVCPDVDPTTQGTPETRTVGEPDLMRERTGTSFTEK